MSKNLNEKTFSKTKKKKTNFSPLFKAQAAAASLFRIVLKLTMNTAKSTAYHR
jgi:hypothetical protein